MEDFLYRIWTIEEQARTLAEKRKSLRSNNPCWKGYHPVGTKKKGGATVPNCVPTEENYVDNQDMGMGAERAQDQRIMETAAWQKSSGKNKNGGLNKKGVASYRKEHPGSKLQTAVTTKPSKLKKGSKDAKRRASFCARMKGMKKHNTSGKTAHDPNSRINKSLRKWHCESLEEMRELIQLGEQYIKSLKEFAPSHNGDNNHRSVSMRFSEFSEVTQALAYPKTTINAQRVADTATNTATQWGGTIAALERPLVQNVDRRIQQFLAGQIPRLSKNLLSAVPGIGTVVGLVWAAMDAYEGNYTDAVLTLGATVIPETTIPAIVAQITNDAYAVVYVDAAAGAPASLVQDMARDARGTTQRINELRQMLMQGLSQLIRTGQQKITGHQGAQNARMALRNYSTAGNPAPASQNQPKKEHIGQSIGFDSGAGNWADTGSRNKQM
jgi:hypothetical protein